MQFKIRDLDSDDVGVFGAADARYRAHLERFKKSTSGDLWKFFYWDFFHDGYIDQIALEDGGTKLRLHIESTNIRRLLDDNGAHEYVNVGFTCSFQNVVAMTWEREDPEPWDFGDSFRGFHYAEINTSPLLQALPQDEDSGDDTWRSLLIQLAGDHDSWLEVVFSQVDVFADEPAAFALMEASPQFAIPAYYP